MFRIVADINDGIRLRNSVGCLLLRDCPVTSGASAAEPGHFRDHAFVNNRMAKTMPVSPGGSIEMQLRYRSGSFLNGILGS